VASRSLPSAAPAAFAAALASLRAARMRPELRLTEVPAPARIAPYAVALTAEVIGGSDDDDELAIGPLRAPSRPGRPSRGAVRGGS
jgi:hypothetical protein